jgi:hypothetical protein
VETVEMQSRPKQYGASGLVVVVVVVVVVVSAVSRSRAATEQYRNTIHKVHGTDGCRDRR